PYLLVETGLQLITRHYDGEPEHLMILSPQWLGWFLAALFIWRITTPIWRALKHPIATSVAISLLAGLIEIPNVLALPKVLGLLPFYVIGLHFDRAVFLRLADLRILILSPQWLGWFLAALFIWRITTPIWRALKHPIATSVAISLLAGLIEIPNVLALPKVLGLLPFYVIGLHFDRAVFLRLADLRI